MKKNWHQKKDKHKKTAQESAQAHGQSRGEQRRRWFSKEISENLKAMMSENDKAIREFRLNKPVCPKCGQIIENMAESLCDKQTGEPVHFDCVVAFLREQEKISPSERIIYIGKGRFAVAFYPSRHNDKNFSIRRIIEWEETAANHDTAWRQEISGLFSQVR
jgi:hypothetical protein